MRMALLSFAAVFWGLVSVSDSHADLVNVFQIDSGNGNIAGDTFTDTIVGLVADGVTFDATITVVGSHDLNQASTGLGVENDSSNLVSNGEYLQFSMVISNEVGGTVTFDGFNEVDFNSFGAGDDGVLSIDNDIGTVADNFFTTSDGAGNVTFAVVPEFHAIAGTPDLNSFRIDDVTGVFSGVAVPEPSALVLSMFPVLAVFCSRRGRRYIIEK